MTTTNYQCQNSYITYPTYNDTSQVNLPSTINAGADVWIACKFRITGTTSTGFRAVASIGRNYASGTSIAFGHSYLTGLLSGEIRDSAGTSYSNASVDIADGNVHTLVLHRAASSAMYMYVDGDTVDLTDAASNQTYNIDCLTINGVRDDAASSTKVEFIDGLDVFYCYVYTELSGANITSIMAGDHPDSVGTILCGYDLYGDGSEQGGGTTLTSYGSPSYTTVDNDPDPIAFTDQTDVAISTVVESNEITVTGMDAGQTATFSVTGGTLIKNSVNVGTSGTFELGDALKLTTTSSALNSTAIDVAFNVNASLEDTWSVTTVAAAGVTATITWTAPTQRDDESSLPLNEIDYFLLYAVRTEDSYAMPVVEIDQTGTNYSYEYALPAGTWTFTLVTVDIYGIESDPVVVGSNPPATTNSRKLIGKITGDITGTIIFDLIG